MAVAELIVDAQNWVVTRGLWWATSVAAHLLVAVAAMLVVRSLPPKEDDAPLFDAKVAMAVPETEIEHFDVGETPIEPSQLDTDTLSLVEAPQIAQEAQVNTTAADPFVEAGGGTSAGVEGNMGAGGTFDLIATGPGAASRGTGGLGGGLGTGRNPGSGGAGSGFGGRGSGERKQLLGTYGGTKGSERAVAAALNWFARHQSPDGRWSLNGYAGRCQGSACTGPGSAGSDVAATAMALLPFFAAGQTHKTKGPYRETITRGLLWLLSQEKTDGDIRGAGGVMYSQGLGTIALCEGFGLSGDPDLGRAAQAAIDFIQRAQHGTTGGWHYAPGGTGDTSIVGWQVMALKSAQMAGLRVSPSSLAGAQVWLKNNSSGKSGGLFSYTPASGASNTMTAVGVLCTQYLGAKREQPNMQEGMQYFMANLPDAKSPNCYYWYYATQAMHHMPGKEWDTWNRQMRRVLIDTQVKTGCAAGSWDPLKPIPHAHGDAGGRIMVTSL